jgi:hypothetical protein
MGTIFCESIQLPQQVEHLFERFRRCLCGMVGALLAITFYISAANTANAAERGLIYQQQSWRRMQYRGAARLFLSRKQLIASNLGEYLLSMILTAGVHYTL